MIRPLFLLSLLLAGATATADGSLSPGTHERIFASTRDGSEQPYHLFIPEKNHDSGPRPAAVVLHGKGATWQSWFAGTNIREVAEEEGWIVISPHGRGDWFYLGPGEQDVLDSIEDAACLVPIDRDRIYLLGHSMGGFGAANLAAAHPDVFAASVPMATWPPVNLMTNFRDRPLILVHGDADVPVPIKGSLRAVAALELHRVPHVFMPVPGATHDSVMISEKMREIVPHFRDQVLNRQPEVIDHTANTPRRGSAHWIRMQEFIEPLSYARVQAVRLSDRIIVTTTNLRGIAVSLEGWNESAETTLLDINGQLLEVPRPAGFPVITVCLDGPEIEALPTGISGFRVPNARIIGGSLEPIVDLPARVTKIIENRFGADAMILTRDLIALTFDPTSIDEDALVDIFFRYEDELFFTEVDRATYEAWREAGRLPGLPLWWGQMVPLPELPPDRESARVIYPEVMTLMSDLPATHRTGIGLRRALYEHVRTNGSLNLTQGD